MNMRSTAPSCGQREKIQQYDQNKIHVECIIFVAVTRKTLTKQALPELKMSRSLAPEPPLSLGKDSFVVHNTDLSSSTFRIKLIKVSGY